MTYHFFYADSFRIPLPTGSDRPVTLGEAAGKLTRRLTAIFALKDGRRIGIGGGLGGAQDA